MACNNKVERLGGKMKDLLMKDKVILTCTIGLFVLLGVIVVGDFYISLKENKGPDASVIELLQMSITGIVGIVAGYISGDKKKKDCDC
jgi:uncharacterized membrane protein